MEETWTENFSIYFHNLAPYYAFSVILSVIAMFLSWWYSRHLNEDEIEESVGNDIKSEESVQTIISDETDDELGHESDNVDASQAKIKVARHQAIVNKLSANMTPEQLIEEKETEKAQLSAILNLLKKQQEKFQVSDMSELEEQLSLYR